MIATPLESAMSGSHALARSPKTSNVPALAA